MMNHMPNCRAGTIPCVQRAFLSCLTLMILEAAGWLSAAALAQVPAPVQSGPALTNIVVIAQTAAARKRGTNWILWIGIGRGVVLVAGIIIGVVSTRAQPA